MCGSTADRAPHLDYPVGADEEVGALQVPVHDGWRLGVQMQHAARRAHCLQEAREMLSSYRRPAAASFGKQPLRGTKWPHGATAPASLEVTYLLSPLSAAGWEGPLPPCTCSANRIKGQVLACQRTQRGREGGSPSAAAGANPAPAPIQAMPWHSSKCRIVTLHSRSMGDWALKSVHVCPPPSV